MPAKSSPTPVYDGLEPLYMGYPEIEAILTFTHPGSLEGQVLALAHYAKWQREKIETLEEIVARLDPPQRG